MSDYGHSLEARVKRCETAIERLCGVVGMIDTTQWSGIKTDLGLIRQYVRGDLEQPANADDKRDIKTKIAHAEYDLTGIIGSEKELGPMAYRIALSGAISRLIDLKMSVAP